MERVTECLDLLEDYMSRHPTIYEVEKLNFLGAGAKDVYNCTAPFCDEGRQLIAARVESRESEEAHVGFFEQTAEGWRLIPDLPFFPLQDPFVTRIDGQLLFGGVWVKRAANGDSQWRTLFYQGASIRMLKPYFGGPIGMKDLRLAQLPNGQILVLTRPQGRKGGRGKIGYLVLASLNELTLDKIADAPLLEGHFAEAEWGGANEVHPLKNGTAGVLGHIAYFDAQGNRHYYSMVFALDPLTGRHTPVKIIAVRKDFLDGPAKRTDLRDVVFSGGAIRHKESGVMELYAGTSDAEAQRIVIDDPFLDEEQNE
ncbi:DUF1861 family protein [Sporolactobacillus terrae]|uniref:DUF1861 domain-containing protein n=1 Tax=Sporolactobacillus terrae TaxID=269673 RepID=A0A5K7X093_9BACL|nr:DUF1861 family protein [Sporolactobacillus terrae]BBN97993.1 hypothetical protein St703_06980 [Sporolactobacillus terrae]